MVAAQANAFLGHRVLTESDPKKTSNKSTSRWSETVSYNANIANQYLPTEFERLNLDDLGFPKTKNGKDHSFPGTQHPAAMHLWSQTCSKSLSNKKPKPRAYNDKDSYWAHQNDTRKESFLRLQQLFWVNLFGYRMVPCMYNCKHRN